MNAHQNDPLATHEQGARPRPFPTITEDIDGEIVARIERAEALRLELERLDREIEQLRRARAAFTFEGDEQGQLPTASPPPGEGASDASLIRYHAARAMRLAGRPLNRSEILEEMKREGVVLSARDPSLRIGKVLWRSDAFVSVADGYWLAGTPLKT